jgi:hypothetical protein
VKRIIGKKKTKCRNIIECCRHYLSNLSVTETLQLDTKHLEKRNLIQI